MITLILIIIIFVSTNKFFVLKYNYLNNRLNCKIRPPILLISHNESPYFLIYYLNPSIF